jgi:Family of unknown function (DUF6535)
VTVLDLKPNSQDTSAFHLNNIQQLLADPNISRASIPSQPPPFSPPLSAIWVNALLFLSLVTSLTCALLATLLQQWARRYLSFTQQQGYSPHKRARIRAFFSHGVDKFHVSWVVEALPALLHLSLCLLLASLLVWLFNLNIPVFRAVVWMVALSAIAYMWITFLPIFQHNSPYYAPLSSTLWSLYTGIPYAVFKVLSFPVFGTSIRFNSLKKYYHERLSDGIRKTAEKTAWQMASEIDVRILESTLNGLKDGARARFFEAIPGFFDSDQVRVKDLEEHLHDFQTKFRRELHGFLDSTFSSNLVSESVKSDQLIVCLNATHAVLDSDGVSQVLYDVLNERWRELPQTVEMAHSLRRWSNITDGKFAPFVRRIVTQIITGVRERDDRWISLAKAEFDVPDHVLRDNIDHGDSVLLSLLTHITREAFRFGSWTPFTLSSLTQFDIRNTLPELQHEFCTLWNRIVQEALRGGPDSTATEILREIRHAYIGLHQGTDAAPTTFSSRTYHFDPVLANPLSYQSCNIASHRPEWTPSGSLTDCTTFPPSIEADEPKSASSSTQVGDSPNPFAPPTPLETQRFPDNADTIIFSSNFNVIRAASQRADDANISPGLPSFADFAIKQSDDTLSSIPGPVYITHRVLPTTRPSVPEVGTAEGAQILHPFPSMGHPQHPSQQELSVADTNPNHMRPEDPRACPYSRETERASRVASLSSVHLDSRPTAIEPTTGPMSHSSVLDLGRVFGAPRCLSVDTTSPSPPKSRKLQDSFVPCAASDISELSSNADPIPPSIPNIGGIAQRSEQMTIVLPTIFSPPQVSPIPMLAVSSSVIPAGLSSPVEFTCIQSDHISRQLGHPSSLLSTTRFHIASPPSSLVDIPVATSSGIHTRGGTSEREMPALDIVASSSPSDKSPEWPQ